MTLRTQETTDYEGGGPAEEDDVGHDAGMVSGGRSNMLLMTNQTALLLPIRVDAEELHNASQRDTGRGRPRLADKRDAYVKC